MPHDAEPDVAEEGGAPLSENPPVEPPSVYSCPDCGGVLWGHNIENGFVRYNCHVGHSYSADGLMKARADEIEEALWSAVRALEENASLALRLLERAESRNTTRLISRYRAQAEESQQRADVLRKLLMDSPRLVEAYGYSPCQKPVFPVCNCFNRRRRAH